MILGALGMPKHCRRSAHVGNADLRKVNDFLRSRTGAALGVVRDAAVHRLLDTRTQATRVRAPVKVRPQNSHVVKLERCAKLTDFSDLRRADSWLDPIEAARLFELAQGA